MSNSVLPAPGEPASGLCEFQGLLIQWFMVADSFWVLCMALNVFLVFFYGYGVQQLRHLEKWYFAFNYGIPCIPVIAYVVLSRTGHPVIGSAMLWCWVSVDVEWMRIAFFYVPAWWVPVLSQMLASKLLIGAVKGHHFGGYYHLQCDGVPNLAEASRIAVFFSGLESIRNSAGSER